MIRVAFVLTGADTSWLGGARYYANLMSALHATPEAGVDPCVFHGAGALVPPVASAKAVRLRILDPRTLPWALRIVSRRLLNADVLLERRLAAERVEVISHVLMGRATRLPTIAWIPDLQHRHLPELFGSRERASRDRYFDTAARSSTIVLASSETARRDIEEFYPASRGRVRVLPFVHSLDRDDALDDGARARHGIPGPFVLLPNQFWVHKNHGVVVDALRILKARGNRVLVVCTGNTSDYRHPRYFAELTARIRDAGVSDEMRVLGMVPHADLASLMRDAVAILNPSLFEGWSTSVEEAKSLGKKVILSSIPVHREQAPERGIYFDPLDPESLAAALLEVSQTFDPEAERVHASAAAAAVGPRRRGFAEAYGAIVHEARAMGPRAS